MWRGPSWGMTNWIVNQGLEKHQYNVESGKLLVEYESVRSKKGVPVVFIN
jgi:hypothetical protein